MSDLRAPAAVIPGGTAAAVEPPAWLPGGAVVEVAVTTAAPGRYHYRVPPHLAGKAALGSRVLVRFGGKKITGVVVKTGTEPPADIAPLDISDVLDQEPSLSPELVELCLWIAEYYEAPPGEVLKAGLPAGSGVTANAFYALTDAGRAAHEGAGGALPPKQRAVLLRLAEEELPSTGLNASTRALLAALVDSGLVELRDERSEATKLKREKVVRVVGDLMAARGKANAVKRNAVLDALSELSGLTKLALAAAADVTSRSTHPALVAPPEAVSSPVAARHSGAATATDAVSATESAAAAVPEPKAAATTVPAAESVAAIDAVTVTTTGLDSADASHPVFATELVTATDAVATPMTATETRAFSAIRSKADIRSRAAAHAASAARTTSTAADPNAVRTAGLARNDINAAKDFARARGESLTEDEAFALIALQDDPTRLTEWMRARGFLDGEQEGDEPFDDGDEIRVVPVSMLEQRVKGARTVLRDLEKAGVIVVEDREAALSAVAIGESMHVSAPPELTGEQAHAVAEIGAALRTGAFKPFLLFGVTGSGKTEVYLRVIAEALEAGKTALVLVPEISLTPQLAARFRGRFGDLVAILHSGLTEQARLSEWSRLRRGDARIAVGARSAVFAPLANIGAIVVDEEHDGSFKQDEGVKYHARDVALVRARNAGAVCVLGSGTPSLESNAQAERGAYGKLVLTERPMARPMPPVEVIDLRMWQPDGESFLTAPLRTAIAETLAAGDQVILFLNRRGFSTFIVCVGCGHAFRCPNCSVSLTYHRHGERLACHYCSHNERVPSQCPSCNGDRIERKGLGTEQVASAMAEAFPTATVARLDRDVASGNKIEAVLARVARREVDILVGTQMVTKGHDFPGVTLVGVLCADTGLNLPDFRASERTFQLLAQVAGRAGRGDKPGKVIIQTYRPTTAAVVAAAAHDYERFYAAEVEERREHDYPPHGRLITIRIDGPDEHEVAGIALRVAKLCEAAEGTLDRERAVEILGPSESALKRLRGRSRWQVVLRSKDRGALRWVARQSYGVERPSRVRITVDVDPNSAL